MYKAGDILIKDKRRYEVISKNPDGSLLVRPVGTLAMINIPDKGVIKESVKEGKVIYSGKLRG